MDQFSEWDRFYETYERSLTPTKALAKYKRRRKSIERRKARIAEMRRTIVRSWAKSSSIRAKSAADASSETKT